MSDRLIIYGIIIDSSSPMSKNEIRVIYDLRWQADYYYTWNASQGSDISYSG